VATTGALKRNRIAIDSNKGRIPSLLSGISAFEGSPDDLFKIVRRFYQPKAAILLEWGDFT
jgi:hypothetical protein